MVLFPWNLVRIQSKFNGFSLTDIHQNATLSDPLEGGGSHVIGNCCSPTSTRQTKSCSLYSYKVYNKILKSSSVLLCFGELVDRTQKLNSKRQKKKALRWQRATKTNKKHHCTHHVTGILFWKNLTKTRQCLTVPLSLPPVCLV